MLKRFFIVWITLMGFVACIEPFEVPLSDFENRLVVDGLISNAFENYKITLSRSASNINEPDVFEYNAQVFVESGSGEMYQFTEQDSGRYVSDKNLFRGQVGEEYTLRIITRIGEQYESEPSVIYAPTTIESLNFTTDPDGLREATAEKNGVEVTINSSAGEVEESYLRWTYTEDWKFKAPYPSHYTLVDDTVFTFMLSNKEYCWKKNNSREIEVHSFRDQMNAKVLNRRLVLIPADKNDRLSERYRITVQQHSISEKEYGFWNKLKESSEEVGDVFGKQPFSIVSNVHNVNDEKETVLGYFQVSGITTKSLYINRSDLKGARFPQPYAPITCESDTLVGDRDELLNDYYNKVLYGNDELTGLIYPIDGSFPSSLITTPQHCSDCTLFGSNVAPENWYE